MPRKTPVQPKVPERQPHLTDRVMAGLVDLSAGVKGDYIASAKQWIRRTHEWRRHTGRT